MEMGKYAAGLPLRDERGGPLGPPSGPLGGGPRAKSHGRRRHPLREARDASSVVRGWPFDLSPILFDFYFISILLSVTLLMNMSLDIYCSVDR